jgi:hypothetical protein
VAVSSSDQRPIGFEREIEYGDPPAEWLFPAGVSSTCGRCG